MKILIINTRYFPNHCGGAEATVKSIAEGLVRAGHVVIVVSLAPDGTEKNVVVNGVECIYIRISRTFWLQETGRWRYPLRILRHFAEIYNPIMGAKLKRIMNQIKPDIVSAHNLKGFSPAVWRSAYKCGIPISQMAHDYYLLCGNSAMYRAGEACKAICWRCHILKAPVRYLSYIPLAYVSNSYYTESRLRGAGLLSRAPQTSVIHPSIDVPKNIVYREDKLPGQEIVFGFLGRIDQTKGLDVLLQAFERVRLPNVTLLIGGDGYKEYINELHKIYSGSQVTFLGRVNPTDFFSKIDILVVPSKWHEPFGRVVVEAFSHGIPVIASKVGGITEIITPGETGELFPPGDTARLTNIIQRIADEGLPAAIYSKNCYRRCKDFTEIEMLKAYETVLRDNLASNRSKRQT